MEKKRDYQFDNIKGIMIFCVIVTHAISNLYTGWSRCFPTKYLYYFVYTFHMSVFVFVSGFFSKRSTDYGTYIGKAIKSCLIPYLVFNFLYGFPSARDMLNILQPKWTLWYLLSLFFWKLMAEPAVKFKWPVPVAILLTLFIGLWDSAGTYLSISRTFAFFPFFIAGYLSTGDHIDKIRSIRKAIPAVCILPVIVAAWYLTNAGLKTATLFMSSSYHSLGQANMQGILIRGTLLLSAFLCIFFFLAFVPGKKTLFSNFGMYSVTIYLGHSVVIKLLIRLKIIRISNPFVFIIFAALLSLALCFALGNKKVSTIYRMIMDKISSIVMA